MERIFTNSDLISVYHSKVKNKPTKISDLKSQFGSTLDLDKIFEEKPIAPQLPNTNNYNNNNIANVNLSDGIVYKNYTGFKQTQNNYNNNHSIYNSNQGNSYNSNQREDKSFYRQKIQTNQNSNSGKGMNYVNDNIIYHYQDNSFQIAGKYTNNKVEKKVEVAQKSIFTNLKVNSNDNNSVNFSIFPSDSYVTHKLKKEKEEELLREKELQRLKQDEEIQLEKKNRILINIKKDDSYTNTTNNFNFDNVTNFCLILGFGNYTPFLYIKPNKAFVEGLSRSNLNLDSIRKISSSEEFFQFGPFHALDLKSLYQKGLIDQTTKVKLIDLLKLKNRKSQFFSLEEFNNTDNFLMNLEIESNTNNIINKLSTSQTTIILKEEEVKKLEILKKPEEKSKIPESKINESKNSNFNDTSDIKQNNYPEEIDNNNNINKDTKLENQTTGSSINVVIKKKKKAKDINTALGFYSMTKEEKNYLQHYTPK